MRDKGTKTKATKRGAVSGKTEKDPVSPAPDNILTFNCGQCCAGRLCKAPDMELRPTHKCNDCKKIVHNICGTLGKNDDYITCLMCLHKRSGRGTESPSEHLSDK